MTFTERKNLKESSDPFNECGWCKNSLDEIRTIFIERDGRTEYMLVCPECKTAWKLDRRFQFYKSSLGEPIKHIDEETLYKMFMTYYENALERKQKRKEKKNVRM
jgi:hypothetical protein